MIFEAPIAVFLSSLLVLWISTRAGDFMRKLHPVEGDERDDLALVTTASLSLLALIIGFSFSMAITRYDQRKNLEEEEANAIGTEYLRADLLTATDAARIRGLLLSYLDQRMLFYTTRSWRRLDTIDGATSQLQTEMWSIVQRAASAEPTPPVALVVSGMNDVLNSQGYTQAAWRNRIPGGAWLLMVALACCCSLLLGYGLHRREPLLLATLPVLVSIAFFLIADIDTPRSGIILVHPQNLMSLSQTLHKQ